MWAPRLASWSSVINLKKFVFRYVLGKRGNKANQLEWNELV